MEKYKIDSEEKSAIENHLFILLTITVLSSKKEKANQLTVLVL